MAEGEIAHDDGFQLYLTIKLSFMGFVQVFATIFSKSSAAVLLYVGKG